MYVELANFAFCVLVAQARKSGASKEPTIKVVHILGGRVKQVWVIYRHHHPSEPFSMEETTSEQVKIAKHHKGHNYYCYVQLSDENFEVKKFEGQRNLVLYPI